MCLQQPQLRAESGDAVACGFRHAIIVKINCNIEQLLDAVTPDRRDEAKLRKRCANGVNDRILLTHEDMACAMQHKAAVLFCRLGPYEPHICRRRYSV